jgi:aspartate beta-hydroxylase
VKILDVAYDGAVDVLRGIYGSRIRAPAVLDAREHFPGAGAFVGQWRALQQEALDIARNLGTVPRFHELMAQQAAISAADDRDWRMYVVKAYGVTIRANAARCPVLQALVAADPDVLSASLSFLAPGKQVPAHRGPFRGVIRYYLALSVPAAADGRPGTVLTIDGVEHRLGDGQALLWDDTYLHDVHNDTGGLRIALLLDVRRRGMPADLALLSSLLIAGAGLAVRMSKAVPR